MLGAGNKLPQTPKRPGGQPERSAIALDRHIALRKGLPRRYLRDFYHFFLAAPWPVVLIIIAIAFLAANTLFALGYFPFYEYAGLFAIIEAKR